MKKIFSILAISFLLICSVNAMDITYMPAMGIDITVKNETTRINGEKIQLNNMGATFTMDVQVNFSRIAAFLGADIGIVEPLDKTTKSFLGVTEKMENEKTGFLVGVFAGLGYNLINTDTSVLTPYGFWDYSYRNQGVYTSSSYYSYNHIGDYRAESQNLGAGIKYTYLSESHVGMYVDIRYSVPYSCRSILEFDSLQNVYGKCNDGYGFSVRVGYIGKI